MLDDEDEVIFINEMDEKQHNEAVMDNNEVQLENNDNTEPQIELKDDNLHDSGTNDKCLICLTDADGAWICCDVCDGWFHQDCAEVEQDLQEEWYCDDCSK